MSRPVAQLLEDGGAAAVGEGPAGFFRSPPFLAAEGATHTLRVETDDAELLAPLVVREIGAGPDRDGVSPYGYPGLALAPPHDGVRSNPRIARRSANAPGEGGDAGAPDPTAPDHTAADALDPVAGDRVVADPLDPAAVDWSGTGLVSVFIRHRLDLVPLAGSTGRNVVQIADPQLKPKSRPTDRRQIRRNLEAGYTVELVPGAEAGAATRAGFLDLYAQTMRRAGAAEHYFFGAAYFDLVLGAERTWLATAADREGAPAASSIACVSDGYLHYYLSGSSDAHLGDSPMKNVVARLVELAAELGLPLNLGGGIAPGDALEEFKRGFGNRTLTWRTSEIVCDPDRYAALAAGREAGGFFPAYRAPA